MTRGENAFTKKLIEQYQNGMITSSSELEQFIRANAVHEECVEYKVTPKAEQQVEQEATR